LFASLLGYNPVQELLGPHALAALPHAQQMTLTSRSFFPSLIAGPFKSGLHAALDFAIIASLLAAASSWTRGGRRPAAETPLYGINPGLAHTEGEAGGNGVGGHRAAGADGNGANGANGANGSGRNDQQADAAEQEYAERERRLDPARAPAGASSGTGTGTGTTATMNSEGAG